MGSGAGRQARGGADAVESAGTPTPDHEVAFLLNFFDELRRRVPARKRGDESMFVPKLPRSCRKAQP